MAGTGKTLQARHRKAENWKTVHAAAEQTKLLQMINFAWNFSQTHIYLWPLERIAFDDVKGRGLEEHPDGFQMTEAQGDVDGRLTVRRLKPRQQLAPDGCWQQDRKQPEGFVTQSQCAKNVIPGRLLFCFVDSSSCYVNGSRYNSLVSGFHQRKSMGSDR